VILKNVLDRNLPSNYFHNKTAIKTFTASYIDQITKNNELLFHNVIVTIYQTYS